jgi:uncharacterized protein (DUF58 family)
VSRSGLAVFGRLRRASADRRGHDGAVGLLPADDAARSEVTLSKLELLVTRKLDGLLQGDYLGLLPGPGSEPGESREYRPGDDVRRMDWPVTARTTVPHVRQTIVDRELETWLAVDLSASLDFGTASCLKRDLAVAAVAAMAHLTVRGGNRIGAIVGTGEATHRIPARPGRRGAQALLRAVAVTERPHGGGRTDLAALVDSLNRPPRRRGMVAVISDFLAPEGWERPLRKLAVRHDVLAIEVLDPRELELPDVGVLELVDPESGAVHEVQTTADVRARYAHAAAAQRATIAEALRHAGVAHLRLRTDSDWLLDIVRFVAAQRHARTRGMSR